jgi:hypothetical protein
MHPRAGGVFPEASRRTSAGTREDVKSPEDLDL